MTDARESIFGKEAPTGNYGQTVIIGNVREATFFGLLDVSPTNSISVVRFGQLTKGEGKVEKGRVSVVIFFP